MLKRMATVFDPLFIAFFKILVVTPFLACHVAFSFNGFFKHSLNAKELATALTRGAIAIGLGDMIYFIGLSLTQANVVAPLNVLTPTFAPLIAVLSLKEKPDLRTMISVFLVVIGIVSLTRRSSL